MLFFTSPQFNCFLKELVLNHLLHKVGDLRSIGMLASKLLLNQISILSSNDMEEAAEVLR